MKRPATVHIEQEQLDLVKVLARATGISQASLHREGLDLMLRARAAQLPARPPVSSYEDEEELQRLEVALRSFRERLDTEAKGPF